MQIIHGDCLDLMREIPDGSIDLIVTDPPYNIGKDRTWDARTDADYLAFMGEFFDECYRVLRENGQMYFFHNDMQKIAELMGLLTSWTFGSFLVFPKPGFRKNVWGAPSDKNALRTWFNICEYALLYVKAQREGDRTGWERVSLDVNNFVPLRKYAYEMLCYIGGALHIAQARSQETSEAGGRSTSSIAALAKRRVFSDLGGRTDHFTRYGSTQWGLATPETYQLLTDRYNLRSWDGYREYEDLRREYEDLRPVHTLDKDHCNVWSADWTSGPRYHACQKPLEILERMIRCSSRPGDVVLDSFAGSGSTGVACVHTGRDFIGMEMDGGYFEIAKKRIEEAQQEASRA